MSQRTKRQDQHILNLEFHLYYCCIFDLWVSCGFMLWVILVWLLLGKIVITGYYAQAFQLNYFMPAVLMGTIDLYHLTPLSLTLTLAGDHKVSAKQNMLASFSHTLCNWSGWDWIWCWSIASWTSWCYFWVRFNETWEIMAVFWWMQWSLRTMWLVSGHVAHDKR